MSRHSSRSEVTASKSNIPLYRVESNTDAKCHPLNVCHVEASVHASSKNPVSGHLIRHKAAITRWGSRFAWLGVLSPLMSLPVAIGYSIVMAIFIAAWLLPRFTVSQS